MHAPVEVRGDRTGRTWRYDLARPLEAVPGFGVRAPATNVEDGSQALIHRLEKRSLWEDDVERLRRAIDVASIPEVAAAPTIRRLLDVTESDSRVVGEWEIPGYLVAIWEWADISLQNLLDGGNEFGGSMVAAAVAANVGTALDVLHGVGIVHLDVAPNNILRVAGDWKLADLDSCTERGLPVRREPNDRRLVHPDRNYGVPARDAFDTYGLNQIVLLIETGAG